MQRQDNLKQELRQLMENLLALQTDSSDVPERKLDIIRLEQDLLNERAKCQALRDEMKKPINVHRWRKLQDSDPEHYEKLQKLDSNAGIRPGIYILYAKPLSGITFNSLPVRRIFCRPKPFCSL